MKRFLIVLVPVEEPSGCGVLAVLLLFTALLCGGLAQQVGNSLGLIPPTATMTPYPTNTPTPLPNWKAVANGVENPVWSPDSQSIAYVYDHDIWIMTANGSNKNRLTFLGETNEWNPGNLSWVSDGSKIAFFPYIQYRGIVIIGTVSLDTKKVELIRPKWLETRGVDMAWMDATKDGKLLIATTKGIWLVNTSGNLLRSVYIPANFWELPENHWMLDDNKLLLVFDSEHMGNSQSGDLSKVRVIDLDNFDEFAPPFSKGVVQLNKISSTKMVEIDRFGYYSHSGDKYAKPSWQIVITNLQTNTSCEVRTKAIEIIWSPDDSKIMFINDEDGISRLQVADVCA